MRALVLAGGAAILMITTPVSGQADSPAVQPAAVPSQPDASAATPAVDPDSVAALKRMSDYLGTLKSFQLTSNSTIDVVTVNGQRVQLGAVIRYEVMRPGIRIDFDGDLRDRQFFYDGKTFTINAPKLNFYATAPAPATNREFLKAIYEKFGISLPLDDLFRWNDSDHSDLDALTSGFSMGTANVDGVATDHWAFRQGVFDWEVWIEQGDRPIPRKLVIIDRTDPAMPAYSARLAWTLNPTLSAADFTFVPGAGAMRIPLATLEAAK
jgi:hypothetical protein